ncbi:MAG: phosphoribosylglycinamide formyltransferase-1 [Phycisphaerales bacterium]|jgi:phosphoribosylglycinamide formyltransferase-1
MPAPSPQTPRLALFLSGSGRSLTNLITRTESGELGAQIALVVASRECPGAQLARAAGLPTLVIARSLTKEELLALTTEHRIDWVVLAGYLRLLPIPTHLQGRVVNIHPALLPAFGGPGMHGDRVHTAAIEAFKRGDITETGCTVHLCDNTYDTGPIVLQKRCPIEPADTPQTLADRVFALELLAYPEALNLLIDRNA